MAYGDLSEFLPSGQGQQGTAQGQAYGATRAQYLSSMDQFYAQLEESSRQFDIEQELSEKQFEWQSGFSERQLEESTRLTELGLAQEKELTQEKYELEEEMFRSQLAQEGAQFKASLEFQKQSELFSQELATAQFGMEQYTTGLEGKLLEKELNLGQTTHGVYSNYMRKKRGINRGGGSTYGKRSPFKKPAW